MRSTQTHTANHSCPTCISGYSGYFIAFHWMAEGIIACAAAVAAAAAVADYVEFGLPSNWFCIIGMYFEICRIKNVWFMFRSSIPGEWSEACVHILAPHTAHQAFCMAWNALAFQANQISQYISWQPLLIPTRLVIDVVVRLKWTNVAEHEPFRNNKPNSIAKWRCAFSIANSNLYLLRRYIIWSELNALDIGLCECGNHFNCKTISVTNCVPTKTERIQNKRQPTGNQY